MGTISLTCGLCVLYDLVCCRVSAWLYEVVCCRVSAWLYKVVCCRVSVRLWRLLCRQLYGLSKVLVQCELL